MKRNETFATLLSDASYLPGVIALHRSLRLHSNKPFVCVCSQGIDDDVLGRLHNEGIEHIRLDKASVTPPCEVNKNGYSHWDKTFDKLLLWSLTQYDKIVYLDADMMVCAAVDDLFLHDGFSAVAAGQRLNHSWNRLNSGLIVIEPSGQTCRELIDTAGQTISRYSERRQSVGDQDVLNDYLPHWPEQTALHIDEGYNLFFKHLTVYHRRFGYNFDRNIRIIHFIGQRKPWHDSRIKQQLRMLKLLKQNPYALKPYRQYLSLMR